ncbi:S-adenosylmethionine decarboxylase proenzyme [Paradesulfitobacterium aromaticivorans]
MDFSTFGRHVVADAWGINFELLNDVKLLQKYMVEVAKACCLTILSAQAYKFQPQGASIILLIAESHFSIHTYPEKGFAAIDCYTCGEAVDSHDVVTKFLAILKPNEFNVVKLVRGLGAIEILENQ